MFLNIICVSPYKFQFTFPNFLEKQKPNSDKKKARMFVPKLVKNGH